jgi:diketogulonate reductase-like aldo/keto reductase
MTTTDVRTVALPSGERVPVMGLGTWHMAEDPGARTQELAALRLGLELGMRLVDTAEMYANGAAEELVGEAIAGRRDEVFLVSKVLPQHATRRGAIAACEQSLRRLGTDRLDLYLLHWRGGVPLNETLDAFRVLQHTGLIRHWGVSNFDLPSMKELVSIPGGSQVTTDQVLYNPTRRGIEYDLLPWCRKRGLPIMAYSPIEQGRLAQHTVLEAVAAGHAATPTQVALAWTIRQRDIIAIPKAGNPDHVLENRAAVDLQLTDQDLEWLDLAFPPPEAPQPLEII